MTLKEKCLENLGEEEAIEIMADLGSDYIRKGQWELRFHAICHNPDSWKYNLAYYIDGQNFVCYSNHCEVHSIFDVVMAVKGWTFKEALHYVVDFLGVSMSESDESDDMYTFGRTEEPKPVTPKKPYRYHHKLLDVPKLPTYEKNFLNCFKGSLTSFDNPNVVVSGIGGWLDEGISLEVMQKFGIGFRWDPDDECWGEIIIPCLDIDGNLIGVRRRLIEVSESGFGVLPWNPNCLEPKYKPFYLNSTLYTFPTGSALYGIYQNLDAIKKYKKVVVFEGEKSVLKAASIYGFGKYPCVASFTHNLTDLQISLLHSLGVEEIILAYDYDGGNEAMSYERNCFAINDIGMKGSYMYNGYAELLSIKDAPIDKGKEVFEQLVAKRKIVINPEDENDDKGDDILW